MAFMTLITNFVSILDAGVGWGMSLLYTISLFLEGVIFEMVSYSYKLFSIMCGLNFNSIYSIVAPLIDRLQAVIMVVVAYKVGMGLIQLMINPENAPALGKELLINIFITVALLLSYNLIFSVLNEVSMLILGTPEGYSFTVLNELAGVTNEADEGLIMRFVFGENQDISEIGDYIAYQSVSVFIRNTTSEDTLGQTISESDGGFNFMKLNDIVPKINKTVEYTPVFGILLGGFLIYTFFNISAEVGTRMFKLLILQMLAPVAIITIIKDGFKGATFQGFIKQYFSIYIQVFVRMLSTLVVTVLISKFATNLGSFFGTAWGAGDDLITKGLIFAIVLFAGYKFAMDAPSLIDGVFGTKIAGGGKDGGFASFIGGTLLGGAAGLATGMVGGIASAGAGNWANAFTGGIAGGFAGLTNGLYTGATKGNTIADKVKNVSTINGASNQRRDNWRARGGFNNVMYGAASDITGVTKYKDYRMNRFGDESAAIEALEKAQVDAIKGQKMSTSDSFVIGTDSSTGAEIRMDATDIYSSGFENVSLGDSADSYAQKMLEYDNEYQQTQAALSAAQSGGDATAIATAQRKHMEARNDATKRAKDYWESKKLSASSDKIDSARKEVIKTHNSSRSLGEKVTFKNRMNKNSTVDVGAEKSRVNAGQAGIQGTRRYKATHPQNK